VDFLEDIENYEKAMYNAYKLIVKDMTLDDFFEDYSNTQELTDLYLPFDPLESDGRDPGTIDIVITFMESMEEYEKCQKLLDIKTKCLKTQID
jgi:hypothetical protein|tara:strand:- start:543 stop:821 length:279 start_codon:yes stop_codon:yes gene_type:complete